LVEAAALIYGDVYDALKPFAQKARGSRGRDPRNRRGAAVTSVHALVIRRPALCTRRLGLKGWFEFGGAFSCVDAAFSRRSALSQGWRRAEA